MAEPAGQGQQAMQRTAPEAATAPVVAAGGAGNIAANLMDRWSAMSAGQRTWLFGAALATIAVAGGLMWLSVRPDWRVLYAGLDPRDEQQVAQQLTQAQIKFDVSPDGATVRVAADQLDKARLQVAAKGMPQSGRMGFELFDKPNWAGSEFDERVNYQRALEGELEHTIGTLGAVSSARVHIVLPKDSLFAQDKEEAKASVVLQLRRQTLDDDVADSIRNLVAGAVEGLRPEQVTLVDAAGRVNLNPKNKNAVAATEEAELADKLVSVLEPEAGADNVRASVMVQYDDSTDEQTDEVYDPTAAVPTSVQRTEQTMSPRAPVMGVPGTASNTAAGSAGVANAANGTSPNGTAAKPPATAATNSTTANAALGAAAATTAANGVPVYPAANGQVDSEREESTTYAVTRRLRHTELEPGRVDRITAAVVVNDKQVMEGAGKDAHTVWKPRTPEEMQRLTQLAQAAVGYDSQRGDEVVVENMGFSNNIVPVVPNKAQQVMDQASSIVNDNPGAIHLLLGAGGVFLLLFLVLRPAAKKITEVMTQPRELAASAGGQTHLLSGLPAEDDEDGTSAHGEEGDGPLLKRVKKPRHTQALFDHVTSQIKKEPTQSVRLLETWINATDTRD